MKQIILNLIISLSAIITVFAQENKWSQVQNYELELINEISLTFIESEIILSPFIYKKIETDYLKINELSKKYGFIPENFKTNSNDTLLLIENIKYQILNPDSLIRYENLDLGSLNFIHPILYSIKKQYNKDSFMSFHRPIFSKDKKYAIVQYWGFCGYLCGWGEVLLMKKEKGKWVKKESFVYIQS